MPVSPTIAVTGPDGKMVSVPVFPFPKDVAFPIVLDEHDDDFFSDPATDAINHVAAATDDASVPSLAELLEREKKEQEAALRRVPRGREDNTSKRLPRKEAILSRDGPEL
ncbi:hypothetical protein CSOJ01_13450 [Colletotrichum sojae]|uniref:Uncharacterized protein n=1 Tax=Colletotrichum sojae TaxID=2175907 RepID=A0A8H6IT16_9PEZI|nr:hypothetical protein CSOJ01_13450 [Colletotrichum sojae]